jgi:ATP-dependent Lon protease
MSFDAVILPNRFLSLSVAYRIGPDHTKIIENENTYMKEKEMNTEVKQNTLTPILALRDIVVYPGMVVPLFVGREKSVQALEYAMQNNLPIILVAQKDPQEDEPGPEDVYSVGTLSSILQMVKLPDGTHKVLIEGGERVRIDDLQAGDFFHTLKYTPLEETLSANETAANVLAKALRDRFEKYVKRNKKVPRELINTVANIDDLGRLPDTIAAHLSVALPEKQKVLEISDVAERMEAVLGQIESELELMEMEKKIRGRVKNQMEKSQREYYLNEQIKAIQKELTELDESNDDFSELEKQLAELPLSEAARKKADAELKKLKMMPPMSAEASVVRNYLETLAGLPWGKRSEIHKDLEYARKILDEDHYGLEEVKERILEYLAVQQRMDKIRGPILCLVGPPGVGKTSLGKSIAKATNRDFVRMSLGGVRDEAEIRGHRRTYIGSMPGRIIQNIQKAGSCNPLMVLDELDKMSNDFRGDPASALLEVLDPEQNSAFNDHYLEIDFDLSEVMFVATANSLNIPGPLRDRMEIITLPGYTEEEKIQIAKRYLVPKQISNAGLKRSEIKISETAIRDIIRYYTREAGVRNLERAISRICRKAVKQILTHPETGKISVSARNLKDFLGVKPFSFGLAEKEDEVGTVTGLAWTEVGGDLLQIEASVLEGTGKQVLTGHLGDVMKESIQAAMTVVRARRHALGIPSEVFQKTDIHVHVPEGATPKDGPSAGIAMCTALVSALTNNPVRADVAMTGEITLRGRVLEIGGLKEKLLAALRGGIKTVLIPADNEKDLEKMPEQIKQGMEIIPVKRIDDVLQIALKKPVKALDSEEILPAIAATRNTTKATTGSISH